MSVLAERLSAVLLTGERRLRRIAADSHRVKVHGILWVFEQLIEEKIITQRVAHAKLIHLIKVNNRLPRKAAIGHLDRRQSTESSQIHV